MPKPKRFESLAMVGAVRTAAGDVGSQENQTYLGTKFLPKARFFRRRAPGTLALALAIAPGSALAPAPAPAPALQRGMMAPFISALSQLYLSCAAALPRLYFSCTAAFLFPWVVALSPANSPLTHR